MEIYLAGPDVFRLDVTAWADSARETCKRYGFEPLIPTDSGETTPERIYQANLNLIRRAQIVVANLNPFRGPEPDSGTAFEMGFAAALGKRVYGYVTRLDTLARRVELAQGQLIADGGQHWDRNGLLVENFGFACNLMLAMSAPIVEGGLEACLSYIRTQPTAE